MSKDKCTCGEYEGYLVGVVGLVAPAMTPGACINCLYGGRDKRIEAEKKNWENFEKVMKKLGRLDAEI